jgi:O-methyltransferase
MNSVTIWHSQVWPFATYSPWLTDAAFQRVYDEIKHHTLVDHYLCYDLWHLVTEAAKLGRGDLIEVGSWRGGTGFVIARKAELCNLQNTVYLCDTFTGVVKAGALDTFMRAANTLIPVLRLSMNWCDASDSRTSKC